jgi:hypothetical protein
VRHSAWRRGKVKRIGSDGSLKKGADGRPMLKVAQTIGPCDTCRNVDFQKVAGCPLIGREGEGAVRGHIPFQDDSPAWLTCPEHLAGLDAVREIYELLPDYRRGALGNVLELPIPLVSLLQILEAEISTVDEHLHDS